MPHSFPIVEIPFEARHTRIARCAPSLRPGTCIEAYAFGDRNAELIVHAWRFTFPVRFVAADDSLWSRIGQVSFHG